MGKIKNWYKGRNLKKNNFLIEEWLNSETDRVLRASVTLMKGYQEHYKYSDEKIWYVIKKWWTYSKGWIEETNTFIYKKEAKKYALNWMKEHSILR